MSSIAATVDAVSWEDVNAEAALDDESVRLKNVITSGFPDRRDELPEDLRYFNPFRDELYVIDNTVFKEKKMLIPKKLRVQIVEALHAAHQGVSSMKANARDRFFWPHLDADIKNVRSQCKLCNEIAPSQTHEQIIVTPSLTFRLNKWSWIYFMLEAINIWCMQTDIPAGQRRRSSQILMPNQSYVN